MSFTKSSFLIKAWQLLLAYIALVPFYYLGPIDVSPGNITTILTKYLPVILITLILLVLYSSKRLPLNNLRSVNLSVFFYVLVCTLSLLFYAEYPVLGLTKLIYYTFTGFLLFYLAIFSFAPNSIYYKVARWVVTLAALVSGYGLLEYLTGRDLIWGLTNIKFNPYYTGTQRIASTLGNAVCTGAYLTICFPFCLWSWSEATSLRFRWLYGAVCILVLIAILITFSRGAWIATIVAVTIYHIPKIQKIKRYFSIDKAVFLMVFLLLTYTILARLGLESTFVEIEELAIKRALNLTSLQESEAYRISQYSTVYNTLSVSPLLGIGFGNYHLSFEQYKHISTPADSQLTTTDNMYLMILAETGIVGLCIFLLLIILLVQHFRTAHNNMKTQKERDFVWMVMSALCAFLINMATWDALNHPAIRMTFWILVGIGFCPIISSYLNKKTRH